ncbi:IS66 family transposase [Lactobacillus delbrueckii subsp. lactis]|uniref:IS66 family transposase n=1 Tax=Lactobacillus delbrueckii TaxID=1584 RepID=UPI001E5E379A|nr:transposase [Lactobacillus delbrueckii]MCD5590623.1 transposase [Lactobacillus delbrueckii subsp. lactis]
MTRTCPRITETITYKRRKQVGRKQDILDSLPGEEVHHRLDDLTCPDCQHELKEIGSFCARQELLYIPAQVKRIDHIQHSYKCQHCSDEAPADKIIKAPVPKAPLTNSLGSASLISNTIYQKYVLKVPAYRQEKDLRRMGLPLDHKTVSNWHIKVCEYYLSSLYELLRKELLKQDVIHADETPYRVLDSERAKDYVWTLLSGKHAEKQIVLYNHGSRKGAEAWDFLAGFMINILPKDKAIESDATLVANQGINYCSQMFSLERAWEDLSAEERYEKRQFELKPLLEKFSDWCSKKSISVLPSGKQGTAFKYCMKHMDKFMNALKDSRLELSNNRAERAVKEIVMGRKNWLFSQSSTGAKSMAIIMSILETAKQNGLDQFKYINYLLDKLPNELSLLDNQRLEAYLPWAENVQLHCK